MKILSFSYCFPNHLNTTWGVFVSQRLTAVARHAELRVVSPVPDFPVIGRLRGFPGPTIDTWQALTVYRPRYLCVPSLFKSLDGRFYARSLRSWLDKLCVEWKPHVLDAHFVWPDGVGVSLLARRLGLPYAVTLRGKIYPCLEITSQRRQCAEALRGAAVVISVDSKMAQIARELGVSAERIHVIPNGVDLDHFHLHDKLDARRQLGLPEEGPLLLTVAHLGPRKGHRETIQALARTTSGARLVLVGEDGRGGRNVKALRELARSLDVENRLLVLGRQPYSRLPLYFSAADASILASWREGCPNVVLESLASGTPVIASDVGHAAALVDSQCAGRIVPPRQVEPLARAIDELLDQPSLPEDVRNCPAVRSWDAVATDVCAALRGTMKPALAMNQHTDDATTKRPHRIGHKPPPARNLTCK
ncbi:MAG: glycosyltransferase [Pirellulales bacterium]|nr:glycosyltransferase [Pirellulales bacterium]